MLIEGPCMDSKANVIVFVCEISFSNLEGSEDPRSENPLVRVSSSAQGLLGIKSTSSPSP